MDSITSFFISNDASPWNAARIGKYAGYSALLGGGATGAYALYSRLNAVPHSTPCACREFLEGVCVKSNFLSAAQAEEAAVLLESEPSLREACDRALLWANFSRVNFCDLLLACAEAARLMSALHYKIQEYEILTPVKMGHRTSNILRALALFSAKIPASIRKEEFHDVEEEINQSAKWLLLNVQLQTKVEMEARALTPSSFPTVTT